MQYLIRLLFSFDGRIGRSDFWIATVALLAAYLCLMLPLEPGYFNGEVKRPLVAAAVTLAFVAPGIAVCLKRFNDLGWPVWIAYVLNIAGTATVIALDSTVTTDGTPANIALTTLAVALALAEMIPCGFMKGRPTPSMMNAPVAG